MPPLALMTGWGEVFRELSLGVKGVKELQGVKTNVRRRELRQKEERLRTEIRVSADVRI
jgi:hypothetical protein